MCAVYSFYFQVDCSHQLCFCLRILIAPQSATNEVFTFMSHPKTIWPSMDYRLVWYVLHTAKSVAANISDQGSSLSR